MAEAEILWSYLDVHGLAFRDPIDDLVARHGTKPSGWSRGLTVLRMPLSRPLFAGLVTGFDVFLTGTEDRSLPAPFLVAEIHTGAGCSQNLHAARLAIESAFGAGQKGTASNTRAFEWRFGRATLSATVWPPDLNTAPNARHLIEPDSREACTIALRPGWTPPPTQAQCQALAGFDRRFSAVALTDFQTEIWSDWPAALGPPRPGLGLDPSGDFLVVVAGNGRWTLLPRRALLRVEHATILPARGPGGEEVSLWFSRPDGQLRSLRLLAAASGLASHAGELAETLSLPVLHESWPDD